MTTAHRLLPQTLHGTWTTTASDRAGVQILTITLDISARDIRWSIECELPNGNKDFDSVTTPAQLRDGLVEVTRRAGSFGTDARPCELGVHDKLLSWNLEDKNTLRLADMTGKMRTFKRRGQVADTAAKTLESELAAGATARCVVTPPQVDLHMNERALFKITADGFTTPNVRSEMRYVGDSTGGVTITNASNPMKRVLDAVDFNDGTTRIVRSYTVKDTPFANLQASYALTHPGGLVETVELNQAGRRALCQYRVRLLPNPVDGLRPVEANAAGAFPSLR